MCAQRLKDFKPGPLDYYRKRASFDWKKLKIFFDSEELISYRDEFIEDMQKIPAWRKSFYPESLDETRRRCTKLINDCIARNYSYYTDDPANLKKIIMKGLVVATVSPETAVGFGACSLLFADAILYMGTDRHAHFLGGDDDDISINGCFCLTEIGHGTNTKGMQTTATYDAQSQEFIINTPNFEAAKCWAGRLGQGASVAVVIAQLIVKGEKKGLHGFVVPIRDPKTLIPYPGIIVGDMGEKLGLHGTDNGFVIFENLRIPRENLLNKSGDVTESGEYIAPYKDPNKSRGSSLGYLSVGRMSIVNHATSLGIKALTIAIRYAAVRRQFGPDGEDEVPILEYQTHQHRLLPHLAAAIVGKIYADFSVPACYQFITDSVMDPKNEQLSDRGMEIHAVSSGSKSLISWAMRDAIQECREACAGHGYLKAAGIGDVRNDNDANCTYEGDNTVLLQQTSNWLLKLWSMVLKQSKISTPLQSADFLTNGRSILNNKFTATNIEQLCSPKNVIDMYQWLVCYLLREYHEKLQNTAESGSDTFWAKNNSQVYLGKNLSIAFTQHFILQRVLVAIDQAPDENIKKVFLRLFSLYALWNLDKDHLVTLYRGGFASNHLPTELIHNAILNLCADLKDDAVALIDAVAPPDFIVDSVLGASDGQVYQRLQSYLMHSSYGMSRPTWWREIVDKQSYKPQAKL